MANGEQMQTEEVYDRAKLYMAGEALLIVEFGRKLDPAINDAVLAFDHYLQDNKIAGLLESAPTGRSVVLRFDPLLIAPEKFRAGVSELIEGIDWFSRQVTHQPKHWRLPVCYGGLFGPDLQGMATRQGLAADQVIEAHCSTVQRVFMIGFAPGFLYTGMLPELFDLPRLQDIKASVPAGSISVAIGQTVISSTAHPTGWHTIGRTPVSNFDPCRQSPFLIAAGDQIEFYAIDPSQFTKFQQSEGQGLVRCNDQSEGR